MHMEHPGWHGIFVRHEKKCHRYYYSGWKPLCADCGEPIEWWNIYMSREAAETIQYMDLGRRKPCDLLLFVPVL